MSAKFGDRIRCGAGVLEVAPEMAKVSYPIFNLAKAAVRRALYECLQTQAQNTFPALTIPVRDGVVLRNTLRLEYIHDPPPEHGPIPADQGIVRTRMSALG